MSVKTFKQFKSWITTSFSECCINRMLLKQEVQSSGVKIEFEALKLSNKRSTKTISEKSTVIEIKHKRAV